MCMYFLYSLFDLEPFYMCTSHNAQYVSAENRYLVLESQHKYKHTETSHIYSHMLTCFSLCYPANTHADTKCIAELQWIEEWRTISKRIIRAEERNKICKRWERKTQWSRNIEEKNENTAKLIVFGWTVTSMTKTE